MGVLVTLARVRTKGGPSIGYGQEGEERRGQEGGRHQAGSRWEGSEKGEGRPSESRRSEKGRPPLPQGLRAIAPDRQKRWSTSDPESRPKETRQEACRKEVRRLLRWCTVGGHPTRRGKKGCEASLLPRQGPKESGPR